MKTAEQPETLEIKPEDLKLSLRKVIISRTSFSDSVHFIFRLDLSANSIGHGLSSLWSQKGFHDGNRYCCYVMGYEPFQ